jgi:hypothetical protein
MSPWQPTSGCSKCSFSPPLAPSGTELRGTRCYVAWVDMRTGRLFFLRSSNSVSAANRRNKETTTLGKPMATRLALRTAADRFRGVVQRWSFFLGHGTRDERVHIAHGRILKQSIEPEEE